MTTIKETVFFMAFIGAILLSSCNNIAWADTHVNMAIIAKIESSNNPLAYNSHSGAIGLCQIRPVVLEEYIDRVGIKGNLWDKDYNLAVGNWYMKTRIPQMLRYYRLGDTIENRLWAYNAGIGNVKKGKKPAETRAYIQKYRRLL